ncbi:MAG: TonB-dependent receptor domain-containing protein, partial [Sphingomonadales bacterium]
STLSITRKLNDKAQLRFNTSWAWRAPQVNELFVNGLHHGTASFEIGDSSFNAERSLKQLVQWEYQQDSTWAIDITMHGNYVSNFINLVPSLPATLTLRGAYPTFRFAQINALIYGIDARFEHQWDRSWKGGVKGTLLWARDLTTSDWLQQMPAHRAEAQLSYLFTVGHFRNGYVTPSVLHVMRQTRVPTAFIDYLPPPAAYTLLQLTMGTDWQIGTRRGGIVVGVYNLLNLRYRDYMNRFRYFTDEVGRNFTVQLNWKL